MALSYAQLEGLWVQAGGSEGSAPIAAAVALAESGGNPTSHNPNPPDDSYGLWQINMLGGMGPDRRQRYGLANNAALYDPLTNAKVAVSMSNGGANWQPWSTFTGGAYKQYMQGGVPPDMANTPPGGTPGGTDPGTAQNVSNPITDTVNSVWGMVGLIGNYVFMGGIVFGGFVLIVIGFILLIRETPVSSAVQSVRKVVL